MTSFGRYLPPGVYVSKGANPNLAPIGVQPTVVCLIGQGVGYHTYSETVSFASGSSITLAKQGVDTDSIVMRGYITDPDATSQSLPVTFTPSASGTDNGDFYSTVTTPVGGGPEDTTTVLTKTSSTTIETAFPVVTITYHYADDAYYALNAFTDFTSFTDTYGPPIDYTTGELVSPLSFAAQIAVQNGANQFYGLALSGTGTIQQQFAEAYARLSGENVDANVIVPLWNDVTDDAALASMLGTLQGALAADYQNGVLRMAIVGLDKDYDGSTDDVCALSNGISSSRIVMPWPNQMTWYNGVTSSTQLVDGFYLAAAYGGILTSQAPQVPLTYKHPLGFGGIPPAIGRAMTVTAKNQMASSGIALTETARTGQLRVRHGLTTNYAGGVIEREISVVRQSDMLYDLVRTTLEAAGLIGQPITVDTAFSVKGIVQGALERAVATQLIIGYTGLAVREQSPPAGDPTIIEVQFAYQPTYPLNYVIVTFTVDVTSGVTAVNNQANITGSTTATDATGVGAG